MRTSSLLALVLFPVAAFGAGCTNEGADAKHEALGHQASAVQGGKSDTQKAHNFAVGIASRYGAVCSGTLIAPNLVLTARHCVVPPSGDESVTCANKFGKNEPASALFVTTEPSLRGAKNFYDAAEVITPTDTGFCGNDIALIRLKDNIPDSEATPATPVVQFSMTDHTKIGDQITAMGYGITSPNANDSGIRRIREKIDIVCVPGDTTKDCKKTEYASMQDSDREFITQGYVCSGDSGGGAFDQESFTNGAPYVLGALSRGPQTATTCLAAIYSRTDAHADLIIAAGEKAAEAGGYPKPAWLSPEPTPADDSAPATPGEECTGDTCQSTSATDPTSAAPTVTKTTTTGCSAAPGHTTSSSLGIFALIGLTALVSRRRK